MQKIIHCDTNAKNTSGSQVGWFRDNYGVNVPTEFNAFLVESIGGVTGWADGYGATSFTVEDFTRNNFNHEMGHVLNLYHTFQANDFVDDTPNVRYRIDYNCNGDTQDNWTANGGLSEFTTHTGLWCHPGACGTGAILKCATRFDV